MRWFKHMSDSHTDEKLAMVQAELGFEGYGLYWFLLEIIAKQMDADSDKTFVEYPKNFWQRLTGLYPNKFKRLVDVLEKFELLSADFSQKSIRVDCPNLLKYRDEWSKKKARNSGATPGRLRSKDTDTDTDTEEEKREKKRAREADNFEQPFDHPETPPEDFSPGAKKTDCPSKSRPSRREFMSCWQVYPVKQGQEEAWREWCRLEDNGTLAPGYAIRDHVQLMAQEDTRWLDGCTPSFAKYLNGKRWDDEPYKKPMPAKVPVKTRGMVN